MVDKTTMETIAEGLGISKVSVYKALKNQPGVGQELRNKVVQAAIEKGYIAKEKCMQGKCFMFIIKNEYLMMESEMFYTGIHNKMCELFAQNNTRIVLCPYDGTDSFKFKFLNIQKKLDGVFICGEIPINAIEELKDLHIPIVCIDYYNPILKLDSVYLNYYYNGFELTSYLIDMGHREIGFVGQYKFAYSVTDRYYGYRRALAAHSLPYNSQFHINENIDRTTKFNVLLPKQLPTAYICVCDAAARKLYMALDYYKYKVPEDISVVSFDNTALAMSIQPALTSMGEKNSQFANEAFTLMAKKIKDPNFSKNIVLDAQIHIRDSVLKINSL